VVVEDDLLVAQSLRLWLTSAGGQVTLYPTATEALAAPDIMTADAYISDYRLPGALDGIEFLDAIQACSPQPIVGIIISGDTCPAFIDTVQRAGWPVLFKPVDPQLLRTLLAQPA
jgi:DNA-binding NtrC family response regulator